MSNLLKAFVLMLVIASASTSLIYIRSIVEAAAPITIAECKEISSPGYYVLSNNITGVVEYDVGYSCIYIEADNVVLDGRGFAIKGFGEGIGIYVRGKNVTIKNTLIENYYWGISLAYPSANDVIESNNVRGNNYGINIPASLGSTIANNVVSSNRETGIYIGSSSSGIVIANNLISGSSYAGMEVEGCGNFIVNNTFEENNWAFIVLSSSNNTLINNTVVRNVGSIIMDSSYNIIAYNVFVNNGHSIVLENSWNNILFENLLKDGGGINLANTTNNTIVGNTVLSIGAGICIDEASEDFIYLNDFLNSTAINYICTLCEVKQGTFYSPEPLRYTYRGREYVGNLGNYWGDYKGLDKDGDGIGDEPYIAEDPYFQRKLEVDPYPLVEPRMNYIIEKPPITITPPSTTTTSPTPTTTPTTTTETTKPGETPTTTPPEAGETWLPTIIIIVLPLVLALLLAFIFIVMKRRKS